MLEALAVFFTYVFYQYDIRHTRSAILGSERKKSLHETRNMIKEQITAYEKPNGADNPS
jgi:hypothetical protein